MGVFVQISLNGRQTDNGSLSSLDHGKPQNGAPKSEKRKRGVNINRERGLPRENQTHHLSYREDEETCGIEVLESLDGGHHVDLFFLVRYTGTVVLLGCLDRLLPFVLVKDEQGKL